jgi:MHS family proline/betaine transporter-like MFS transporter
MIASQRKLVIAGLIGNVLEWYDFSVYGYFAVSIGRHFFPSEDPANSLLAAFGVFAAGFLMRPVGAVLFGHIGDNWSRERALSLSVLAMAVPTFLIGVIPDYQQIGVTASVLLVLLRLAQGISVGGEYTTSIVFVVERSLPQRRGFMGIWCLFGTCAGTLLGSAIATLLTSVLPRDVMRAWGWRLPFILGLAIGIVGLYIRRDLERDAKSIEPERPGAIEAPRESFLGALKTQRLAILKVIGLKATSAVGFYTLFVYMTVYYTRIVQIPKSDALAINTIALAAMLVMIPARERSPTGSAESLCYSPEPWGCSCSPCRCFNCCGLRSSASSSLASCASRLSCAFSSARSRLLLPRPFPDGCAAAAPRSAITFASPFWGERHRWWLRT